MLAFGDIEAVGPYSVTRFLGRGSFGVVLLAEHNEQQKEVALKLIPCNHLDAGATIRARSVAQAEAELLRRLRHPHIVTCHEMHWEPERCAMWLVLDFMDGGDLRSFIEARRGVGLPAAQFQRRVLAAIGSALRYIHAMGILHRDVKPSNILLTQDTQEVKLTDFGISKILEFTNHAHSVVGTPHYLSPEIVSGNAYGPASDAWALGVCMYELASLRRPFEASNQLALVRQIVEHPLAELPPDTASDIARVVNGLLERDQWQRLCVAEALATSSAIKAFVPLPPAPLFPPPPAPARSAACRGLAFGQPGGRAMACEQPSTVIQETSGDLSLITDQELLLERPPAPLLEEEPEPVAPTPRREDAFGVDAFGVDEFREEREEEEARKEKASSKKPAKSSRSRSWFGFRRSLRTARYVEKESEKEEEAPPISVTVTPISAFSDERAGRSSSPVAHGRVKSSPRVPCLP
mmetsp:Transcript_66386/g.130824  ORF Transcript_66386/g.130824 Transcript_66386/m.130824 type:complete len:465 (+) Transcript_66386:73-1467(+)